eukprot:1842694-Amphidinium_carterae.1
MESFNRQQLANKRAPSQRTTPKKLGYEQGDMTCLYFNDLSGSSIPRDPCHPAVRTAWLSTYRRQPCDKCLEGKSTLP